MSSAERVEEMADREAIRELPLRYCDAVWRQDADAVAELYTKDGAFDAGVGTGEVQGRDAIRQYLADTLPGGRPLPFIHNHVFDIEGDRARGRCSVEIRMTVDGERRTGVGFYEDEYLRDAGRWRFRARRVTLLESPF